MKHAIRLVAVLAFLVAGVTLAAAQSRSHDDHQRQSEKTKSDQKADHNHDSHLDGVSRRGDAVMGFSHAKTTHHFLLKPDGGVIQVEANDANDGASRDRIRQHLKHIAKKFSEGDFTAPMLIHAQTPPGAPAMQSLRAKIKYEFEELERGGLVRISTSNPDAVKAIHEFLRFQIKDHKTGDSGEIEN
jgi:pyruvate/2-oxoglutarate dehydrogenase complex dihydrolipoamide acyltransferase (E2) component